MEYVKDFTNFNHQISISDSLIFKKEIRFYKHNNYQNICIELVRIYESKGNWLVEYYKCNQKSTLKIDGQKLFYEILKNRPEHIPDENEIQWKYMKFVGLEKSNDENYQLIMGKILAPNHGNSYSIFINFYDKRNHFNYYEPKNMLQNYPNIDELILVNNLLNLIQQKLNIWVE